MCKLFRRFTWLQFVLAAAYEAYRNRSNYAVDSVLHWNQLMICLQLSVPHTDPTFSGG